MPIARHGSRVLPRTAISPSSLPAPMPHMPSLCAKKPTARLMRPFLMRLSKDESANAMCVFCKKRSAARTTPSKSMPWAIQSCMASTQRAISGPVERESSTAMRFSGARSSASSQAICALFMLPDRREEMAMAMHRSACSNSSSQACGVGQEVWLAISHRSIASSMAGTCSAASSTKSSWPALMIKGTLETAHAGDSGAQSQLESVTIFHVIVQFPLPRRSTPAARRRRAGRRSCPRWFPACRAGSSPTPAPLCRG